MITFLTAFHILLLMKALPAPKQGVEIAQTLKVQRQDNIDLKFPLPLNLKPIGFWLNNAYYLVFNTSIPLPKLNYENIPWIRSLTPLQNTELSGFKIEFLTAGSPQLKIENNVLTLGYASTSTKKNLPLDIDIFEESGKKKLTLNIAPFKEQDFKTLKLDQENQVLKILFLNSPEISYPHLRSYVDLSLLPSQGGIAILESSKGLSFEKTDQGLMISTKSGLIFNAHNVSEFPWNRIEIKNDKLLDFSIWQQGNKAFFETLRYLEKKPALEENLHKKIKAFFELTHFYLSYELLPEAESTLNHLLKIKPDIELTKTFKALLGTLYLLKGNRKASAQIFKDPILQKIPKIKLWQSIVQARSHNFNEEIMQFLKDHNQKIHPFYPLLLRRRVIISYIRKLLDDKNYKDIPTLLNDLKLTEQTEHQRSYTAFLQARYEAESGNMNSALHTLSTIIKTSHSRLNITLARFYGNEYQLANQKISLKQAIEELETLQFAWRGDSLELDIREKLSDYYDQNNQTVEALRQLKNLASLFPSDPRAQNLGKKMQDLFSKFLLKPDPARQPFQAVSFYQEFKELTPAGQQGFEVMRKMVDDYLDLDLLDQAVQLIKLIKIQNPQNKKSDLDLKLAQIWLDKNKYAECLETLKHLHINQLNTQEQEIYRFIEAKALYSTEHLQEALKILNNENLSYRLKSLKADIYMELGQLQNALLIYENLFANKDELIKNPKGQIHNTLLNYVLTASKLKKEDVLQKIKNNYKDMIEKSPHKETLNVLLGNLGNNSKNPNVPSEQDEIKDIEKAFDHLKKP
jgi:tetratricopeptide (TPR) repeat protein